MNYLAAFSLGLFSAVHCWGMCGGIIAALAMNLPAEVRANRPLSIIYIFAYNLGRISSYSLAGLIAGASSQMIFTLIKPATTHVIMVWFSAVILLLLGLTIAGWLPWMNRMEQLGSHVWKRLQPIGRGLLPVSSPLKAWAFGLIWGWLPCGLVYSALLLSLSAGSAVGSAGYMFMYGLGTLPAVMGAGLFTGLSGKWLRQPVLRQGLGLVLIGFSLWNVYGLYAGQHGQHGAAMDSGQSTPASEHSHHHHAH